MSNHTGVLYIVATPIGNLDDFSARARQVLSEADLIAAEDTRHSQRLLSHFGIRTPMLSLHEHNEQERVEQLLRRLREGQSIALISDAGTPLISDPGFPLVRGCRTAGLRVVPVPGPSALIAALSVSGLPTDRFRFEGFLPRQSGARRALLEGLRHETATLVFYESSHRVLDSLRDMAELFPERHMVLARELTKLHETIVGGSPVQLEELLQSDDNQRKGEFVLLVAGNAESRDPSDRQVDELLAILAGELPLKQAAAIAARITGLKKNALYQRALELREG